jgi:hypothetical protein
MSHVSRDDAFWVQEGKLYLPKRHPMLTLVFCFFGRIPREA